MAAPTDTRTDDTDPGDDLPRWDTTAFFPGLDSKEFNAAREGLGAEIGRLEALYDQHDVRDSPREADEDTAAAVDEVLAATNRVWDQLRLVRAYLNAHTTTDSTNALAQRLTSQVQRDQARLGALSARLTAWAAALPLDELMALSDGAADHEFALRREATSAQHQMSELEENLASQLMLTGSTAWSRLYSDLTSSITAVVSFPDGHDEELPIFAIRSLANHEDRATRRAAYEAELAAWEAHEIPIAAAMNAIKGETIALNDRRGWPDDVEPVLHRNHIDRGVLDAMQEAVKESLPDFRRYLHTKARLLGVDRCAFYDLFAPVGQSPRRSWDEATDTVRGLFDSYSPALRKLADRAFDDGWIDVAPRKGKVGGAFCMGVRDDESRVLLNFDGSADSIQTLAHELGHAYHNTQLAGRTPLQRSTPMALAETASIFCETLAVDTGLKAAEGDARLALLEVDLQGSCQVVVDIHSRFLFESRVFEARRSATLSPGELCELMRQSQIDAYGDGLDPEQLHPYMWAAKPHYYATSFYNWPYTYGLLFGIGLFAAYRQDPERFRSGYDDLLSATGMASGRDLGQRFGIDVASVDFWRSSIDVLRERIGELDSLVD